MGQMSEWPTAPCRGTGQDVSKQQLVCLGLGRQLRQQKVTNRCRKLQVTASTSCRPAGSHVQDDSIKTTVFLTTEVRLHSSKLRQR